MHYGQSEMTWGDLVKFVDENRDRIPPGMELTWTDDKSGAQGTIDKITWPKELLAKKDLATLDVYFTGQEI